jgi:hypothetical protein
MRKVGYSYLKIFNRSSDFRQFLMRTAQELVKKPELVHEFERGGVNGVAPEITQEIRVLLEHSYIDSGTSQQEAEHHTGGASTCYATSHFHGLSFQLRHGRTPLLAPSKPRRDKPALLKVAYPPSAQGPNSQGSWNPTLRKVREGLGTLCDAWAGKINGLRHQPGDLENAPAALIDPRVTLYRPKPIIAIGLHQ